MIKEIRYGGYTAETSDYACPDGDLAFALNLINENGSIVSPVLPPTQIQRIPAGDTVVAVHKHSAGENLIYVRQGFLCWRPKDESVSDHNTISAINGFRDIAIVGNTLAIASDDGLSYVLYSNGEYKYLGDRPPFVSIDFGLENCGIVSTKRTYHDVPAHLATENGVPGSGASATHPRIPSKAETEEITAQIFAHLLSGIADQVTSKGRFYQPFFVRYAFRLYDGTYRWHSAPVLMLPTVVVPAISIDHVKDGFDGNVKELECNLAFKSFELNYRIISDHNWAHLQAWSDIIAGIDVFVTAPIYTYDQSKSTSAATYNLYGLYNACSVQYDVRTDSNTHRGRDWNSRAAASGSFFDGHYSNGAGIYEDHITTPAHTGRYWNIPPNYNFVEDLKSAHQFYRIASIDIKGVAAMSDFAKLTLDSPDFSNLVARPTLPDDYNSHCSLYPRVLHAYNNRLNLANTGRKPAPPLPVRSSTAFNNPSSGTRYTAYSVKVWLRSSGQSFCIERACNTEADIIIDPHNVFPRYLYYPDAAAYKMQFVFPDDTRITIPLEPHDFLNGAYYFGGLSAEAAPPEEAEDDEATAAGSLICEQSKLYTSEASNPFLFPVQGITTVGQGKILGLSSAAKALSQGQFGQFPLYAFTTEGVWALEVGATGSYTARQPVTRDVCINPAGITQIDSAVLFPTARGIMLISGSNTVCLSESINNDCPFDLRKLPQISELHTFIGHRADSCLPVVPFSVFLKDCRMIYDYTHQRIIVCNRQYTYAYIYSLKTKLWGMMHSAIVDAVNSYPEALAVTADSHIVDFSQSGGAPLGGLLVTRPLKLDAADVLKTVDTVIQRGRFAKGHVQSVLYGSRDLDHWHLVWSSRDHYLRGFRGTPYKYFRIALVCRLDPGEDVAGATMQFTPRHTDALR